MANDRSLGCRVSEDQFKAFEALAKRRGQPASVVLRDLVVAALDCQPTSLSPDPLLSEIIGVRLLIVNLFKPFEDPEAVVHFDRLLDQIKATKKQLALKIQREGYPL